MFPSVVAPLSFSYSTRLPIYLAVLCAGQQWPVFACKTSFILWPPGSIHPFLWLPFHATNCLSHCANTSFVTIKWDIWSYRHKVVKSAKYKVWYFVVSGDRLCLGPQGLTLFKVLPQVVSLKSFSATNSLTPSKGLHKAGLQCYHFQHHGADSAMQSRLIYSSAKRLKPWRSVLLPAICSDRNISMFTDPAYGLLFCHTPKWWCSCFGKWHHIPRGTAG